MSERTVMDLARKMFVGALGRYEIWSKQNDVSRGIDEACKSIAAELARHDHITDAGKKVDECACCNPAPASVTVEVVSDGAECGHGDALRRLAEVIVDAIKAGARIGSANYSGCVQVWCDVLKRHESAAIQELQAEMECRDKEASDLYTEQRQRHAEFRSMIRQALKVPSNPGWSDEDFRHAIAGKCNLIQELQQQVADLTARLAAAEKKNLHSLANNLCPDHRDKQQGKPCLACEIEGIARARDGWRELANKNGANYNAMVECRDNLQTRLADAEAQNAELRECLSENPDIAFVSVAEYLEYLAGNDRSLIDPIAIRCWAKANLTRIRAALAEPAPTKEVKP